MFFKPLTVEEAVGARDALAKHIYAQLFNGIVTLVNKALESTGTSQWFIGVLDIYGFETFDINSFVSTMLTRNCNNSLTSTCSN